MNVGLIELAVWLCGPLVACVGVGFTVGLASERRRSARTAELVARAPTSFAGPLAAAHLAVQALARESGTSRSRYAGIDVQLQRAALAVADLAAAPHGGRAADRRGLVDVGEMLEAQLRAWRPMAAAHDCEIRLAPVDPGLRVAGDPIRLAQAVGNVVANAIEHGRGPIVLAARTIGDHVRIEVCDGGPGLPAPVADLATRAPRRGEPRGRGLAIASDIAHRHGGRLAATPAADGTRMALDLPRPTARP